LARPLPAPAKLRRSRRVRWAPWRSATGTADRSVFRFEPSSARQVGHRQHQAPRQHQPAVGCLTRRGVCCVHRVAPTDRR
jgi:hypothetical protein